MAKIRNAQFVFPNRNRYKIDYSDDVKDLVEKLLQKDKADRLGAGPDGHLDILNHPFFKDIDIKELEAQSLKAPYVPTIKKEEFAKFFDAEAG